MVSGKKQFIKYKISKILYFLSLLYLKMYKRFKLNKLYHRLGLSVKLQARLLPRMAYMSDLFMFPVYIRLDSIKWGGNRVKSRNFVLDGDWDLTDRSQINEYLANYIYSKTIMQLFVEGLPYYETDQYKEMISMIDKKQFYDWRTRGCRTEQDVELYFNKLTRLYMEIKTTDYKTQKELGKKHIYDEIAVYVDSNGELQKRQGCGQHRLAVANLLKIDKIPVIIQGVHYDWLLRCHEKYDGDIISIINSGLKEISCKGDK